MKQISVTHIGASSSKIDLFESQYPIPEGMGYNSYLIKAGKTAVMDTCDPSVEKEWMDNLLSGLDGAEPDYLVVHHMEPDHSSMIARLMDTFPGLTLVCSAAALKMIPNFFPSKDYSLRSLAVSEGQSLDLDGASLTFYSAPMVHWPEVMVSYLPEKHMLFSADAFGSFGAVQKGIGGCSEDLTLSDIDAWKDEARRYYCNICGKYGAQVGRLLSKIPAKDVEQVCPLHGPILGLDTIGPAIELYSKWANYTPELEDEVMVACASIHGSTLAACGKLVEMLKQNGISAHLVDLCRTDVSYSVADAFRCRSIVLAASSYDAGVFPPMHDFLYHLQIKGLCKRRFAIVENGSWAPSAAKVMKEMLSQLKQIELLEPVVSIRSRLKDSDMPALEQLCAALVR